MGIPQVEAPRARIMVKGGFVAACISDPSSFRLCRPRYTRGKGMADFIIERDPEFPRVVQLMGIESPGLTSAPAIAEHVTELVAGILA